MNALRQLYETGSVEAALGLLRQHLARPAGIFDPHASLSALEQLVDVARAKGDNRASRLNVVLRQTRPLLLTPSHQQLLVKLVGDKEEVAVAKEIQKAMKHVAPMDTPQNQRERPRPYPAPRSSRSDIVCFACGKRGHIARTCWGNRRGSN